MTRQPALSLILPKGWPRRVRSAVIHAIGLARLVLVVARAQATSGSLGRVCIDRLQQEILLLREEMRLKDTRIARVPAQRRPKAQIEDKLWFTQESMTSLGSSACPP